MTNADLFRIAMEQSAVDLCCNASDFLTPEHKIVLSRVSAGARRYLKQPFVANLVSYGSNVVASVGNEAHFELVRSYLKRFGTVHSFETPDMLVLEDAFRPLGARICFQAEYFLPDLSLLRPSVCPLPTRLLTPPDFAGLYTPEWSNALCRDRPELDVLGVGAYDGGTLVGLAACSADCDTMWQIGIDILPAYRRRGIACALTSALACEIVKRGKVPFYCAAWSNIPSVRNAIRSGFRPAWVELSLKTEEYVRNALDGCFA